MQLFYPFVTLQPPLIKQRQQRTDVATAWQE